MCIVHSCLYGGCNYVCNQLPRHVLHLLIMIFTMFLYGLINELCYYKLSLLGIIIDSRCVRLLFTSRQLWFSCMCGLIAYTLKDKKPCSHVMFIEKLQPTLRFLAQNLLYVYLFISFIATHTCINIENYRDIKERNSIYIYMPYSRFYLRGPKLCELCKRLWVRII